MSNKGLADMEREADAQAAASRPWGWWLTRLARWVRRQVVPS